SMLTFNCDSCRATLYFENDTCLACGHRVGFRPDELAMCTVESAAAAGSQPCRNWTEYAACNWFAPAPLAPNAGAAPVGAAATAPATAAPATGGPSTSTSAPTSSTPAAAAPPPGPGSAAATSSVPVGGYCVACSLNEVVPDLADPHRRELWIDTERA